MELKGVGDLPMTAAFRAAAAQLGHWSLERAMDRIASAKRRRGSPDEDEAAEQQAAAEAAKTIAHQAR